ncbi:hypothetical protein ACL2XO_19590 [Sodalis sp. RH15]|uniref:hypothetical protein n=1 Tax=Sodalis sp. RH15 TaxID=3394330 RepID=UPI0039B3A3B0
MTIKNKIEKWKNNKTSFFFFLPDGPYGRPFDNQYVIESIGLSRDGLEIIFSDDIVLRFSGEPQLLTEDDKIRIIDFKELLFIVKGKILKQYAHGDVTINGF